MKFNGQNIIADSDIVMTGQQAGHNLSEVLNQHDEDISNLKSNVKWIYKYGGVGSGSGGSGGGSQSTAPWNFKVELDDVVRENGSKVNLGTQKEYKLFLQLYKVQGRTFDIKYTYNSESGGVKIVEKRITPSQPSSFTDLINLQVNGTLAIAINDDEGNYAQFTMDYIVTAYSFAINYVYADDKSIFYPVDNNIFITDVQSRNGLFVRLTQIISVDVKDYYIRYQNWNQEWQEMHPDPADKYIDLDLGKSIDNSNAGNYTFIIEPHIILAGNNEEEKIENLQLGDNLIPDTIYLKVETDGTIYNTDVVDNPYQFYAGEIVFKVTGFQGFKDTTTSYIFSVYLNDNKYTSDTLISELQDQYEETIGINIAEIGWQKITFQIARKNAVYEKTYWICTKSALGSFTWYPSQTIQSEAGVSTSTANPIISYQYKYSQQIHNIAQQIPGTPSISNLISQTVGGQSKIYRIPAIDTKYQDKDCLLSVGINFNRLNDLSKKIITISGSSTSNSIEIYQNKIIIMGETYNLFYLPMDDKFHLISIYRRAASKENGASLFEFIVYIDGVIEVTLSGFVSTQENYNTIELNSGLYKINYLEVSYFNHTIIADNKLSLLEQYNPNPNKYLLTHLTDTGILYHYYSYKLTFEPESIPENFQKIYSYVSQFYNNVSTGRVEVTNTGIAAIAQDIEIPVLMLKYREPRNGNNPNYTSDGSAILNWMQESIDIKTNPNALSHSYPVDVAYSKGKEELKNIVVPENVSFQLFLQGTSTLIYTSKNFDLALSTSSPDYTYLYSPNYSSGDPSTFLPEKRFTIKADVVDSSHSNNNAIGKFVNTVCTKFQDQQSVNENSKYKAYLKNTLEGFPILLFLENAYYKNATTEELTTDYYFLGIYNFNLGRDSEYNLGFKDLRLLPENITDGFAITEIPNDVKIDEDTMLSVNSYLANLGVMEINDNRTYFDFSQDHDSILFSVNDDDNDYMFSKFKANNLEILKSSIKNLVTGVSYSGGYIFEELGKNLQDYKSDTEVFGYGYDLGYKSEIPTNSVPNYKIQLQRTFENAQSNLTKIGEKNSGTQANLSNLILGNEEQGTNPLLDYVSLTEYFVICMAFGLLDSVLKNMNFRKWLDKFYLAFYDMDTCLGKDNAGNNSDYLCFSDYWAPASTQGVSYNELRPAISYKDWYDSRIEGGFDIPSSYLFAVAKYSSKFIEGDNTIQYWYPQNVWARFRRKETQIQWTSPLFANEKHVGCLTNADSFIDNFFAKHLEKVPDVLFNLNYRIKYLHVVNNKIFANEDWKKLSGKRIHYVRDWLNSRFHILDLYFNMAAISDSVITYDIPSETWQVNPTSTYPLPNPIFIDSTNEDITVCQDAFVASESGSESTKYSSNIDVIFTTAAHSPIALAGGFQGRYLTDANVTQKYRFRIDSNGKSGKLGGSKNWLTLNSINSLIQGNVFFVNSDKLTVLNGDAKSCGGWHIKLPALEKVTLTSASYTGNLEFTGANNWPNLTEIDIRDSKLGLIINNVGVKKIIATNVGPAENLSLMNCNNLSSINLSGSIFENIQMTPPQNVVFFGSSTYKLNDAGKWEVDGTNNPPKCSNLTLNCPSGNGVLFISDQTYTVNGVVKGLSTLVVSGYKEIYIDNCPYLQEIIINSPENVLQKLHVKNCATSATQFRIGSTDNVVDLTKYSKLEEVNFYLTKKFEKVYLPDNVQIQSSGFSYTNIKTLDGKNLKLNTSAFSHSSFTLLQSDGTLCSFDKTQQINSLNSAFRNCNIQLDVLNQFNSTYTTLLNRLTNVDYMWWANPATKYNEEYLLEDYVAGKCRFDFSMYTNVTTAKGMLGGLNVQACHADTLKGFAKNSATVNLNNLYGWSELSGKVVTIPLNWLEHVKTKVTDCNSTIESVIYKVITYEGNAIKQKTTFSPKDLFGGNSSNKITELKNWVFDSGHTIDLKGAFLESEFPKLHTITKSFVNCNGANLEYVQNIDNVESIRGFLYSNTKINNIQGSFGFNNYNSITVDWASFLNWENLPDNYKGFQYVIYWDEKYHVWQFNKTLNTVNQFNVIYNYLLSKYTGNSLFGVFYNCIIDEPNNYQINLTTINDKITDIPYLFSGLKIADNYINWDWNMIATLPNVVNFTHAFEKIKFANSLPFNLFKRRKESVSSVYVKNSDGDFESAVLHKYTYEQAIKNMQYCFQECEFEIPMYNLEANLVKSYLEIDGEVLETNIYYTNNSALAAESKLENTEFDDITQIKGVAFEPQLDASNFPLVIIPGEEVIDKPYHNWDMHSAYSNQSVLPPDIFYGCINTVDLTGCFKNSNLQGFIPDNLFKNCKSAIIKNFLSNVLIFPKYYDKKYSAAQDELLNIYYYIGTNFINSTNLDEAFDFKIHLPGYLDISEGIDTKQLHVFCFSDSFSINLNSMKNALPASIKPAPEGTIFIVQHLPNSIYLNIMYDKSTEEIIKDSDDNELEIKRIGTLGLQLSKYNKLMLDKLVNSLFSQFIYGNVFAEYTTLNALKRASGEVITLGNGQFGVSRNAIWPAAPNAVSKLIKHTALQYLLSGDGYKHTQFVNGVKILKNQVQEFDDSTSKNYNASRVDTTGYAINFIEQ